MVNQAHRNHSVLPSRNLPCTNAPRCSNTTPDAWDECRGLKRLAVRLVSPYDYKGQHVDASLSDLEKLNAAIGRLNPREQRIIKMRWLDDPQHTLARTGAALDNETTGSKGVTPERVRQMEAIAMRKLRSASSGVPWESWTVGDQLEEEEAEEAVAIECDECVIKRQEVVNEIRRSIGTE